MVEPTVTARGSAVVSARPDESVWTLDVTQIADGAQSALDDVAGRGRELDAVLGELGVAAERRSTSGVSLVEEYDYVDGKQVHRGFRATVTVTVRMSDPADAARLVVQGVGLIGAQVRGPRWVVAVDNPARREAGAGAAEDARAKAAGYAQALGLRLGAVVEIRDAGAAPPDPGPRPMRAMAADSSLEITPGEIEVAAAVDVTFRLEG